MYTIYPTLPYIFELDFFNFNYMLGALDREKCTHEEVGKCLALSYRIRSFKSRLNSVSIYTL